MTKIKSFDEPNWEGMSTSKDGHQKPASLPPIGTLVPTQTEQWRNGYRAVIWKNTLLLKRSKLGLLMLVFPLLLVLFDLQKPSRQAGLALGTTIPLMAIFLSTILLTLIGKEKTAGLVEVQRRAGVPDSAYWAAWITLASLLFAASYFLLLILSYLVSSTVLSHSGFLSPWLMMTVGSVAIFMSMCPIVVFVSNQIWILALVLFYLALSMLATLQTDLDYWSQPTVEPPTLFQTFMPAYHVSKMFYMMGHVYFAFRDITGTYSLSTLFETHIGTCPWPYPLQYHGEYDDEWTGNDAWTGNCKVSIPFVRKSLDTKVFNSTRRYDADADAYAYTDFNSTRRGGTDAYTETYKLFLEACMYNHECNDHVPELLIRPSRPKDKIDYKGCSACQSESDYFYLPSDAQSLLVLVALTGLYFIVTWYLYQVLRGAGKRSGRHPLFPFQRSYWCPDQRYTFDPMSAAGQAQAASAASHSLVLCDVTKRYGHVPKPALINLSLTLEKNRVFCLLGPNGSGKTTLVNLLSHTLDWTSGEAFLDGLSLRHNRTQLRAMIGVVPQFDLLWEHLTAREHLRVMGQIRGVGHLPSLFEWGQRVPSPSQTALDLHVTELLAHVHLTEEADRPVGMFSGGMKRRLSIALASLGNPALLLLDELSTGVDPLNRRRLWKLVQTLSRDRIVILNTHLMDEAAALGDDLGFLYEGHCVVTGTPMELQHTYGNGYTLSLVTVPHLMESVRALLQSTLGSNASVTEVSHGTGSLTVSVRSSVVLPRVATLLQTLERDQLVRDWGITHTSLEEVFLRMVHEQEAARGQKAASRVAEASLNAYNQVSFDTSLGQHTAETANSEMFASTPNPQVRLLLTDELTGIFGETAHIGTVSTSQQVRGLLRLYWITSIQQTHWCKIVVGVLLLTIFLLFSSFYPISVSILMLSILIVPSMVYKVVKDREKHYLVLLKLNGMTMRSYWLAYYLVHGLWMLPLSLCMLILYAYQRDIFTHIVFSTNLLVIPAYLHAQFGLIMLLSSGQSHAVCAFFVALVGFIALTMMGMLVPLLMDYSEFEFYLILLLYPFPSFGLIYGTYNNYDTANHWSALLITCQLLSFGTVTMAFETHLGGLGWFGGCCRNVWGPTTQSSSRVHSMTRDDRDRSRYAVRSEDAVVAAARVQAETLPSHSRGSSRVNPEAPAITLTHLSKHYANAPTPAVHDLSFCIDYDECFGLLGPNGSGKTTLFNLLVGTQEPTFGSTTVAGHAADTPLSTLVASSGLTVGIVPQFDIVYDSLTVLETLQLYGHIKGINPVRLNAWVDVIVRQVALQKQATMQLKHMSGGMRRRVSLAIALLNNPKILLFDEPTTGLDPHLKRMVWNIIESLKPERCIVLNTHAMDEAEALCTRIGVMTNGKLRCLGTPSELRHRFGNNLLFSFVLPKYCPIENLTEAAAMDANEAKFINAVEIALSTFVTTHIGKAATLTSSYNTTRVYSISKQLVDLPHAFMALLEHSGYADDQAVKSQAKTLQPKGHLILPTFLYQDWAVSQTSLDEVFCRVTAENQGVAEQEWY